MRSFVVCHVTVDGSHRKLSQHLTRSGAQRRASDLRDALADIWSDVPLDGTFMGALRVLSYRDWMEVPHKR